jgi:Uma2 family endonuclease
VSTEATARKLPCTWTNYQSWNDGQRWEIIDGEVFAMSPAPSLNHQTVQLQLSVQLAAFFRGRDCQVFPAPVDVKLSDVDVLQPDIVVVCAPNQFRGSHVEGAPTLVVEILSPSTATFDRTRKLPLYAASGVREVWLVTPYPWLAEVFVLTDQGYRLDRAYEREGLLKSPAFPGLEIRLAEVFDFPIPPEERIEMVKEGRPPYGGGSK